MIISMNISMNILTLILMHISTPGLQPTMSNTDNN